MVLRATRSGAASGASESRGDAAVESGGEGQFEQKCIAWQDAAESVSSVLAGSGLDVRCEDARFRSRMATPWRDQRRDLYAHSLPSPIVRVQ